jgi:multimeric flavodoxin WrbA
LEEALRGAAENGADTEIFSVSGKDIRGCDSCYYCIMKGECHIQDDMQPLYGKIIEADGIIFGAPIYIYGITAQAKAIMDRTFALNRPGKTLANKVGGVIVVAGSLGLIDALKDYYFFFTVVRMLPANFVAAYATEKRDAKKLEKGMNSAYLLGKEIVQLVDKKFEYPDEFPRNFFAFGTHTH